MAAESLDHFRQTWLAELQGQRRVSGRFTTTASAPVAAPNAAARELPPKRSKGHTSPPRGPDIAAVAPAPQPRPWQATAQSETLRALIDDLNDDIEDAIFDDQLPREVALLVFRYLSIPDLGTCARVSRQWREMVESDELWVHFAVELGLASDPEETPPAEGWKNLVRRYTLYRRERQRRWRELLATYTDMDRHLRFTNRPVAAVAISSDCIAGAVSTIKVGAAQLSLAVWSTHSLEARCDLLPVAEDAQAIALACCNEAVACSTDRQQLILADSQLQHVTHLPLPDQRHTLAWAGPHLLVTAAEHRVTVVAHEHAQLSALPMPTTTPTPTPPRGSATRPDTGLDMPSNHNGWSVRWELNDPQNHIYEVASLGSTPDRPLAVLSEQGVALHDAASGAVVIDLYPNLGVAIVAGNFRSAYDRLLYSVADRSQCTLRLHDVHGRLLQAVALQGLSLVPGQAAWETLVDRYDTLPPAYLANANEVAVGIQRGVATYDLREGRLHRHPWLAGHSATVAVSMDDWRLVYSTRREWGHVGWTYLADRRMMRRLWNVRTSDTVRTLEFTDEHLIYACVGARPHPTRVRGNDTSDPNLPILHALDFTAPLSELANATCPYSSVYENLYGWDQDLDLRNPYDNVDPDRFG